MFVHMDILPLYYKNFLITVFPKCTVYRELLKQCFTHC